MNIPHTRRSFLGSAAKAACAVPLLRYGFANAEQEPDPRVAGIVASTIGIDTHNHVDVPMTAAEQPGPDLDIAGEMRTSGLSAICATFATDYSSGDAYQRFQCAMAAMDRQLARNAMHRSLTARDVVTYHRQRRPTVIQAVEGAHFLEGHIERVEEAYRRGLRHFGLLHDSDASVPLGDVYTNPPQFGGLTAFGAAVIRECERLGMLIDLAHASAQTTEAALKVARMPVIVSHTGLDTQTGSDPRMAQRMMPRLISKEQARLVANTGGVVGVWTHLSDSPREYVRNIRALVDVIGVDHVCLGTDTKLTQPSPRRPEPTPGGTAGPAGANGYGNPPRDLRTHPGERTNFAWEGQTGGFFFVVVHAMLAAGFTRDEIRKISGENYLRVFGQATEATQRRTG